jgi:S1-C subfamily serine protease
LHSAAAIRYNEPHMSANQSPAPNLGISDYVVQPQGAQITKIDKFGSAGKAGLAVGDIMTAVNGKKLPAVKPHELVLAECAIAGVGGSINVNILRGGKDMLVAVKLTAKKTIALDLEEVSEVLERKISPQAM